MNFFKTTFFLRNEAPKFPTQVPASKLSQPSPETRPKQPISTVQKVTNQTATSFSTTKTEITTTENKNPPYSPSKRYSRSKTQMISLPSKAETEIHQKDNKEEIEEPRLSVNQLKQNLLSQSKEEQKVPVKVGFFTKSIMMHQYFRFVVCFVK